MYSLDHHDLGTPPSDSTEQVTLEIDGHSVTVPAGTSIMRAAATLGEQIPKLCATDSLKAFGSCRLCLVEIDGRKGYPASCTTQVAAGMKIRTQSEKLSQLRHGVMELYASDHPAELLNGSPLRTEIRDMAHKLGVTAETRYGWDGVRHKGLAKDESNPYFTFDPNACIVCSRCVRACDEQQGTLALTVEGRGFQSRVVASQDEPFVESECVSCGACVEACPTTALTEKSLLAAKPPDGAVTTTCAYCGVGCSFRAEVSNGEVVRMVPNRAGRANGGHACVKGRFAYGYATHQDRVLKPMIRKQITDPWREVSWPEAINYAASEFKRIQAKYGKYSVGGITSSRCTNEEAYLVQKLVRAAFGNNNVDTCARVCHSPTGYGLKNTMGESAGTQEFASVMKADAIILVGANPTEGHPVFASQMKRRLRQGAKLIVIDPRQIALVRTPHIEADYHLQLRPGTNVALMNSLSHVVVTEGLTREDYVMERCEIDSYKRWKEFVSQPSQSPEAMANVTGVPAEMVRGAARMYAKAKNGAIYYGLGVTEHSQGTTMVMCIANLAMATGNLGREGVGVNPLRGQNNVQGSCDMGSFPHELTAYRHISDAVTRGQFEAAWGVTLEPEPGLRIPNMFEAALDGSFKGMYVEGEDMAQSDPNTQHVQAAFSALECLVVQDLFLNETAKYAHVFLPGSTFLEKDGTFTNAERRVSRVRKVIEPRAGYADWEVTCLLSNALGYPMNYKNASEILDEIAALTPTFTDISFDKLEELGGSVQWPCNAEAPNGTPTMHVDHFVRGKGKFFVTEYVATSERSTSRYPLLLTTGRILSQYNVGAQTRRTHNVVWHDEDRLEIHPDDAETRGIKTGDWVGVSSRAGETVLRAILTDRVQRGVVYTTFHFPESGANVITTESSDWATNCPEYKVTAVQVVKVNQPSEWQKRHQELTERQRKIVREHSVSQF
jgi:formate dehydrogenase major subunit